LGEAAGQLHCLFQGTEERWERDTSSQGAEDHFAATIWTREAGIRSDSDRPQATLRRRAALREDGATGFDGKKCGGSYGKGYPLVAALERVARSLNEHRRDPRQTIPSRAKTASKIVELTWLSVYELRISVTTIRTAPTSRARRSNQSEHRCWRRRRDSNPR
jgi:hypothetical protein